ncbi:hypothetical protein SAMN05421736_11817 [Evansella caseinilytica]|uniref:YvlB/LiaX N-terminal domain-containing protein n=1 Tax=Evansella caseinilytica TaxID=1503961 RepID=A0A1H3U3G1_9BACI|nr:hypothetical protein [Evansella caseinilytica]SDZ56878.1 hypothetical protein SAMN05421736_11817 [Evansella caseinilytica]
MKNEIMKVLELVQEGELSNSEAAEILSALKEESEPALETSSYMSKSLKIIVDSDGDKVNVNLPLKLAKSLHSAIENIPAVQKHLAGVDMHLILEAIANNIEGPIVDIVSANDEKVKIVIE